MHRLMMIALAAVATAGGTLSVATPAAAQHWRHGHYYRGAGARYGPGVGVYVGPGWGYGYYPYGCRIRLRWDPYVGAYVRTRVCY